MLSQSTVLAAAAVARTHGSSRMVVFACVGCLAWLSASTRRHVDASTRGRRADALTCCRFFDK